MPIISTEELLGSSKRTISTAELFSQEPKRVSRLLSEPSQITAGKPELLDVLAGATPMQTGQRNPALGKIQQAGKDLLSTPAHFVNQVLFDYPRQLTRKAGFDYPERTSEPVSQAAANIAGVAGGIVNPFAKVGTAVATAKKIGTGAKILRGAAVGAGYGAIYAPDIEKTGGDIIAVEQRLKQALFGGAVGSIIPATGAIVSKGVSKLKGRTPESRLGEMKNSLMVLKNAYDDGIRYAKQGDKKVAVSNPLKTMIERKLIPEVKNGRTDTTAIIQKLNDELGSMGKLRKEELPDSISIPITKFKEAAIQAVKSSKQLKESGSVNNTLNKLDLIFDSYKDSYGSDIPLSILDDIRIRMNTKFNPELNDAYRMVGNASRELLYDLAPKTRAMLQKEGEIISARNFADKLNNRIVKGGRLGNYFASTLGAVVGSSTDIPVVGPLIGALGGRAVSRRLQQSYFKPVLGKSGKALAEGAEQAGKIGLGGIQRLQNQPALAPGRVPPSLPLKKALGNQTGLYGGQGATGFNTAEGKFSALTDKMQRFEIGDEGAKVAPKDTIIAGWSKGNMKLGDILDHPKLYKQYPDLKNTKVNISTSLAGGDSRAFYNPKDNSINLIPGYLDDKSVMLHEIQHAIQEKEGFARGGSPQITSAISAINNDPAIKSLTLKQYAIEDNVGGELGRLSKLSREKGLILSDSNKLTSLRRNNPDIKPIINKIKDLESKYMSQSPYSLYQRLAGEVESRDVSARMGLTPKQRLGTMPYSSQNIPLKDMIINKNSGISASQTGGIGKVGDGKDVINFNDIKWNKVNIYLKRKGYDVRGADDVKEIYSKMTANFTKNPSGDHLEALKQAVSKPQSEATKVNRYFGYTNDPKQAGYLTPDGKLLDFSGKKWGNTGGVKREIDHREINTILDFDNNPELKKMIQESPQSNSVGMRYFMNKGNIRMQSEGVDLAVKPTVKQLDVIKDHILKNQGGAFFVDISDINGNVIKSFSYEWPNVKVSTIMKNIDDFYKQATGNIPKRLGK